MTKGKTEIHGCIVCGRVYQLLVAYDTNGMYVGSKVMGAGGREVTLMDRPLVACEKHTDEEIERAVDRAYGEHGEENDD